MSLRVGLGASQADLDVQGEIDFDFFEESDCVSNSNQNTPHYRDPTSGVQSIEHSSQDLRSQAETSTLKRNSDEARSEPASSNASEPCSSLSLNKPLITISCDDATGIVQKTNIETVIPTPYTYRDNKCGNNNPFDLRKGIPALSPHLKNKVFKDDNDISDDSSISSMSESEESAFSSVSEDSFELNESDSMTDVSPLVSPYKCCTPTACEQSGNFGAVPPTCTVKEGRKDGVKFIDDMGMKQCSKCETIDFHELVSAMNRLQMSRNVNAMPTRKCKSPVLTQNVKCRKNLSFSNEEVRKIDNDNQVLLKKIVAQQNRSKTHGTSTVQVRSSSAVTRQRQQRQIELENLALLKRLESTKPTRNLSRSHLLRDYDQRSSGVLSRASLRSSYPNSSSQTSFRTSSHTSGRSSSISIKSSNSSGHSKSFRSHSSSVPDKMQHLN